jgi:hypothetical protein
MRVDTAGINDIAPFSHPLPRPRPLLSHPIHTACDSLEIGELMLDRGASAPQFRDGERCVGEEIATSLLVNDAKAARQAGQVVADSLSEPLDLPAELSTGEVAQCVLLVRRLTLVEPGVSGLDPEPDVGPGNVDVDRTA